MSNVMIFISSGVAKALSVTPQNGIILVFGDSGTKNPHEWTTHYATSKSKNIKIFWIHTPCCHGDCDAASKTAYKGLSEGRVFDLTSALNIQQFFKSTVETVRFLVKRNGFLISIITGEESLWRSSCSSCR